MKRFLVFVFAAMLLAPAQAAAHQPVFLLPSDTSAVKGPLLVDYLLLSVHPLIRLEKSVAFVRI